MKKNKDRGITKIAVKGFKSIAEECAIEIRPLTILAGANSSGKSSIMQPLLILKQTLDVSYDPGPLLIDGTHVQYTDAAQFLSKLPNEAATDNFQIRINTENKNVYDSVSLIYKKGDEGIEISEMISERKSRDMSSSSSFTLSPNMSPEEIKSLDSQPVIHSYSSDDLPEELKWIDEIRTKLLQTLVNMSPKDPKEMESVTRSRCFFDLNVFDGENGYIVADITSTLGRIIQSSIHLPGLRGNPERTYKMTGTGPRFPGTFDNYVASIIHRWQEKKNKRLKAVTASLRLLNLTGQVGTENISDARIELIVDRLIHNSLNMTDKVSLADVGIGVSQVLPLLVALNVASSGQLVYIEQPELHLHPNAQVKLAQVLADAAKRGVRVVIETHSSLLLLGIQTLVAEGKLSPELVKLHWFSRNEEGITQVDSVDLDEAGTYGEWPVDFDDVDLRTESRYLDAVDKLRFGQSEVE